MRSICALILIVAAAAPAYADEPATEPPTEPATAPAPEPVAEETLAVPGIELMPASAYPEPQIRGIKYGSLWSTFHGLQWPYYPKTGIGVAGYAWVDSGYETIERGNPNERGLDYWLQQGRVLVRVTPTYSNGEFFVQGQAELVANKDQSLRQPDVADTDDLWLKIGRWGVWDVQLGRYEGWEVYHLGMGLDLNTLERQGATSEAYSAPAIYGLTYAYYRPASVGQAAVHLYPADIFRVELGTQFGNEFGANTLAARPVGVLDLGWLKIKGGGEYKILSDQKEGAMGETKSRGVGGAVQVVLPPVEFGVNAAYGLQDRISADGTFDAKGSNTTYSVGGFANWNVVGALVVGAGANQTHLEDLHFDPAMGRVQEFEHLQVFGAAQYTFRERLYLKTVLAYANADFAPNFGAPVFENKMMSGRIRLMYVF